MSCLVLPFCLLSTTVLSQYYIGVNHKEFAKYCEPISYSLDVEKLFNTTLNDLVLELSFSEDVEYVSNTMGLVIKETTNRKIVFDYPDLVNCNLQRGEIIIQPKCYDVFTTLLSSFTLKTPFVCLSESEERTIIKSPFIDFQFSDYSYDASLNQIRKTVRLFNAGSVDVGELYILPIADQQFAVIEASTFGKLSGDTIFIENTPLRSKDSLSVELVFNLQNCDLRSITYEIGFICKASSCVNTQRFIDENELYANLVTAELRGNESLFSTAIDYGLCEPYGTTVVLKNVQDGEHTSIGDIYNLNYAVLPFTTSRRRFEECLSLSAQIGDITINVTTLSNAQYTIEFQSVLSDPDGIGGLDDLDGDGEYDDLALGDSTSFDLQLRLKEDCYDNYQSLRAEFDTELRFENFCNAEMSRLNGSFNEGFSRRSEVANYLSGSVLSIEALQLDQSNKRFIPEGDSLVFTYNVRPSANLTRICESTELELLVDIPPTVAWDNTSDIIYFDANDTIVLIPQMLDDTLMRFSFVALDSLVSSIQIPFVSVCDVSNTNYDSGLQVCEQCVEYDLPRFRTVLSKPCILDCATPLPSWESVSAPFYTKCLSLPEIIEPLVLSRVEYYNLSSGFTSDAEVNKRDPFSDPSSTNNRFYFDGDTMMVRMPFEFQCAEELKAFSIQLTENQLSSYEFDIIASDIILLDEIRNAEESRCPADLFLNQSETAISFTFSENSFSLPCLEADGKHVLELQIQFNYNCVFNSNCGLLATGVLQGLTTVQLQNDCTRQVFYKKDTVHVHEVFKEEFFRPVDFLFGPQSVEIFDQFAITTPLYTGLFTQKPFAPEFRRRPIVRSINYTIPEGFEVSSDFLVINADLFFINGNLQILDDSRLVDTLIQLSPQGVLNPDGSRTYAFTDMSSRYYSEQLGDPITAGLIVKSVCNPASDLQSFTVDGVVEYVDYANGSLDTIAFPFSETRDLLFSAEQFIVEDDFQIIDSAASTSWKINKSVDFFLFDNFINEDDRATNEFKYYLKYESKQMRIDSVTSLKLVDQFLFDDIEDRLSIANTFIGDSLIELEILPSILFQDEDNIVYNTTKPTQFVVHTSNHSCGFDTLFFELGRKAEFLQDTCSRDIFTDFFVSYSPPGFPQLEWSSIPPEIKYTDENLLGFRLSNIGQGDLVENRIVFDHFPTAKYSLFLKSKNGDLEDVSSAIIEEDKLTIDLSSINGGLVSGLSGLDLSEFEFVLIFEEVCINSELFHTTATVISQSYCGDQIESPELFSGFIPFVVEEDLQIELALNTITRDDCQDTAIIHILLETNVIQNFENPELRIVVPKDIDMYLNAVSVNGTLIQDPRSELTGDGLSNTFIIVDGLPTDIVDSINIELKLDGSCIDLCRIDNVSAFLLSRLEQQCSDGTVSSQLVTRAYAANQTIRWKPNIAVDKVETNVIDLNESELSLQVTGEITLTDSPLYGGDVSVIVFADIDQNTILDPTDIIVKQEFLSPETFVNQSYQLNDTLVLDPSLSCALHLIVDVDKSCSCLFYSQALSQNGMYTSTRHIQNCNPNRAEIKVAEFTACTSTLETDAVIISQQDGMVVVETDQLMLADTVRFVTDCGTCQFIDEIIIQTMQVDVEIALSSDADCKLTAQVLWNGDDSIPNDFSILWNVDDQFSSRIQNIPEGLLHVELSNETGCVYNDSIFISPTSELSYQVLSDELFCAADFPTIVDIVTEGVEPISIQWNDGENTFQRLDILPGRYQFTITDGSGCIQTDTLYVQAPADLTVQSIVNGVTCDSPISGSIELMSNDPTLEYAIADGEFTTDQTFSNLAEGQYTVYIKSEEGCLDSIIEHIPLDTTVQLAIPISRRGTFGDTLALNPELISDDQFTWLWQSSDFDLTCTTCPNPHIELTTEGQVALRVMNGVCSLNRVINITAEFSDLIYIPNAFSPNAAEQNSRFFVYPNASFDEVDLRIFDRWGNELYAAQKLSLTEAEAGWDGFVDGKVAEVGVYVYQAIVRRFADKLEVELLGDFLLVH